MKKFIALLCASIMTFAAAVPSLAASTDPFALPTQADIVAQIEEHSPSGQIIIGSSTQMDANMITGWTNSATNASLKVLIHGGYDTVELTKDNGYQVNPIAVKEWSSVLNDDGSKTYTFELYDNLVYNNGDKITAVDYCFSVLLSYSQAMQELEAQYMGYETIVGGEDFFNGETFVLSGLRMLDDYTFSYSIPASELPDFYEIIIPAVNPMPMHVIAPGVTLSDDGEGCYLSDNFTAEMLQETINDINSGYRYNPSVTCGPYQFVSYDDSTWTGIITVNPNFIGTPDGHKPRVKTIVFKYVFAGTEIDELAAGSIDLLSGQGGAERINQGLDLVDAGGFAYSTYPRCGFGYIRFHCDFGPTQFPAVRQAVTLCLDREEFCRQYTGGYGIVVSGYYGASMWEYEMMKDELEALNPYTKNLDEANRILDEDGWVLDATGGTYVAGEGNIRHKMVDGELMPLILEWCSTDPNQVSDQIELMLPVEAEKVGMKINRNILEFTELLAYNGRLDNLPQKYHMFNLAVNFTAGIYQVWYSWSKDPYFMGGNYNQSFLVDDELDAIAREMKLTDPTDREGWGQKFVDFNVRFNELMPLIPLYSDLYHDFYNEKLKDYSGSPIWTFQYAIVRAYVD